MSQMETQKPTVTSSPLQEKPAAPVIRSAAATDFFNTWKDKLITPLVLIGHFFLAGVATWKLNSLVEMSGLSLVAVWYGFLVLSTLISLKLIRTYFPMKPGVYTHKNQSTELYMYGLYGCLCQINLMPFYEKGFVPTPLKKYFYQLLGGKFGAGFINISGYLSDPHLIEIEQGALIGYGSSLLPHAFIRVEGQPALVIGRICIKKGAVIGAHSVIMPGVTIGANVMITPMTLVPMGTTVKDQ